MLLYCDCIGRQTTNNYADSQCFREFYYHADILIGITGMLIAAHWVICDIIIFFFFFLQPFCLHPQVADDEVAELFFRCFLLMPANFLIYAFLLLILIFYIRLGPTFPRVQHSVPYMTNHTILQRKLLAWIVVVCILDVCLSGINWVLRTPILCHVFSHNPSLMITVFYVF